MADQTTSAVYVRYQVAADVPHLLAIDAATFGDWNEACFRFALRCPDFVKWVACHKSDDSVLGFAVAELGPDYLRVRNLAALTPSARAVLVERVERAAGSQQRKLAWN